MHVLKVRMATQCHQSEKFYRGSGGADAVVMRLLVLAIFIALDILLRGNIELPFHVMLFQEYFCRRMHTYQHI